MECTFYKLLIKAVMGVSKFVTRFVRKVTSILVPYHNLSLNYLDGRRFRSLDTLTFFRRGRLQIRHRERSRSRQSSQGRTVESRICQVRISLSSAHSWRPYLANRPNTTSSRLGQEPPPQPKDEVFDGRSLAEVCLFSLRCILFW